MHSSPLHPNAFEHFRSGSRRHYELYYLAYCLRVHSYLCELTGDYNSAQDITTRVFVAFFANRAKVMNEMHILPFLYKIARNFANEYLREKGRLEEMKARIAHIPDEPAGMVDVRSVEEMKGEILDEVRQAFLKLPARKRRITVLYFWRDMSVNEIAAHLGIAPQTVRNHLSQTLVLLRKNLAGDWEHINLYFS